MHTITFQPWRTGENTLTLHLNNVEFNYNIDLKVNGEREFTTVTIGFKLDPDTGELSNPFFTANDPLLNSLSGVELSVSYDDTYLDEIKSTVKDFILKHPLSEAISSCYYVGINGVDRVVIYNIEMDKPKWSLEDLVKLLLEQEFYSSCIEYEHNSQLRNIDVKEELKKALQYATQYSRN